MIIYPIGRASFSVIRSENLLYVDKTEFIHKLCKEGTFYFLARPRRFGKSLFLDTVAHYFRGNRHLFKGLAIDRLQPGEWERYPVLRFNLTGSAYLNPEDLYSLLSNALRRQEEEWGIAKVTENVCDRFADLIGNLKEKTGRQVVILIDEYDAPLSSTIDRPELQALYREQLHGFYSILKREEENIKFCMLTGVTRYGKVSVFSGLNNLNDITFDDKYAAICGITKEELRENYKEGVRLFANKEGVSDEEIFRLLKFHYDGYHFSKSLVDIYNPYSINFAFDKLEFSDYWCESGTPTILAKSLMQNDYDIERLSGNMVEESVLRDLSMYASNPIPLFYQTGYLTLKQYDEEDHLFILDYPNREVESGVLRQVLKDYSMSSKAGRPLIVYMKRAFMEGKPEEAVKLLKSFLADIPLDLRKNVARYENYYHTIFYCLVKLLGLDIHAEYATSEGYIDILVKTEKFIYVIELKVNGTAEDAIRQISEKHYCLPFATDPRRLYRIGLGFSKKTGTIDTSLIEIGC